MDFSLLLQQNTRTDDYVNATKLCAAFDRRLDKFIKSEDTKAFMLVLDTQITPFGGIKCKYSKRGNEGGTFVHPLLAIKLAEWLSPEFEVYVKTTFKRYLESDVTLATEIVNRSGDLEALKKHSEATQEKVKYLVSYHGITDTLKERECTGQMYASYNKHVNQVAHIIPGRKDVGREEYLRMTAAQTLSELALLQQPKAKKWNAVKVAKDATQPVNNMLTVAEVDTLPVYEF